MFVEIGASPCRRRGGTPWKSNTRPCTTFGNRMYPWVSLAKKSRAAPDLSCNTSLASIAASPCADDDKTGLSDCAYGRDEVICQRVFWIARRGGKDNTGAPTSTYDSVSAL